MSAADLWDRLKARGLVEGDRPVEERPASPWYVRAMLGVAGWIAALFLFLFVGAAFAAVLDGAVPALIAGTACCGAAWILFRQFDGNDFAEQFALAVSLVGQVLLLVGFGHALDPEYPPYYFAVAAIGALLAFLVPNFLHRMLAAGGTALALALAVNRLQLHGFSAPPLCLAFAFVWLEPKRWARNGGLWRPIGYGLALALLLVETFRLFGAEQMFGLREEVQSWFGLHGPLVGRLLSAAVLIGAAAVLVRRERLRPQGRSAMLAMTVVVVLGLASLGAPGLASALLILLLGFSVGSMILMALGIFSLLGFVSHFYYSLHATLLEKSGLLALTGLLLLGAHFLVRRLPPTAEREADHA